MRLFNHFAEWSEAVREAVRLTVGRNTEAYVVIDHSSSPLYAVYEEDHQPHYGDEMFVGDVSRILDFAPLDREQVPGLVLVASKGQVVERYAA